MEYSYRIVPGRGQGSQKVASFKGSENAEYESHDAMRYGHKNVAHDLTLGHELEEHLANFDQTQENLKMTILRHADGVHMPLRMQMEKTMLSQVRKNPVISRSNFSMDILKGRDTSISPEDFMGRADDSTDTLDIHNAMLKSVGLKTI